MASAADNKVTSSDAKFVYRMCSAVEQYEACKKDNKLYACDWEMKEGFVYLQTPKQVRARLHLLVLLLRQPWYLTLCIRFCSLRAPPALTLMART
jgi:hypothetical protein